MYIVNALRNKIIMKTTSSRTNTNNKHQQITRDVPALTHASSRLQDAPSINIWIIDRNLNRIEHRRDVHRPTSPRPFLWHGILSNIAAYANYAITIKHMLIAWRHMRKHDEHS